MIVYLTKKAFERYKLKMPEDFSDPIGKALTSAVLERESGDRLLEWSGKLFYFDGKKSMLLVNDVSRLTIVPVNIKMGDREFIGNAVANYMFSIYEDNKEMTRLLKRLFNDHPIVCFSRLTDKSSIASLNHTLTDYLWDGYWFRDYIWDGIFHTIELNNDINRKRPFPLKVGGKMELVIPAEQFELLLCERYKDR